MLKDIGVSGYLTVYKRGESLNLSLFITLTHKKQGIMINFVSKVPKWPKLIKSDAAYLHSFSKAVLNFEQNIMEERQLMEVSKNRNTNIRSGSQI